MSKRYGFFGGSFNPVTKAHINLANIVLNKYNLDKVILVPMGDHYQKQNLINEKYRYEMLKIATKEQNKLEVSNIELNLPYSLSMVQAFQKIKESYPKVIPYFIIGADNIEKLIKLPNLEVLAKTYNYIILERYKTCKKEKITLNPILNNYKAHFNVLEYNPYEKISSTEVRDLLKNNNEKEILEMIEKEVYEYIKINKLYKK